MAKIEPFSGLHYNTQIVEDMSKVICPPYDVITPKEQEEFYQRHPYNIIRLILGKELPGDTEQENKYTRAAGYMEDWIRRNVLVQDEAPGIYFYEQSFDVDKVKMKRWGFIALMRLDEEGQKKSVYPHEHTHTAPKEDRLKLIKSVEANLSPIFTIFSDPAGNIKNIFDEARKTAPFFDMPDNRGIENRLWRVSDKDSIDKVKKYLSDKELFIADGHHRHEVARSFREYKRKTDPAHFKDSYNYVMTFFTVLEDDGLCILPTHRLVKDAKFSCDDLASCFSVTRLDSRQEMVSSMKKLEGEVGIFGLYKDKNFYLLKLDEKRECNRLIQEGPKEYKNLDVVILQKVIFDHFLKIQLGQINYEVDLELAVGAVDRNEFDALFILNATKLEQIRSIALGGEVMPQKSTYFYPKLSSGLMIHKF